MSPNDHDAPTVLITGSTDGLGKATARAVAANGASVLLHGRDEDKCATTAEQLRTETGNPDIGYHVADFGALDEVRRLADEISHGQEHINVLINNAGIGGRGGERQTSADGHELRFATNYLAHFLLTRQLLALLHTGAPARIVNISSAGQQEIDFDDVMLEHAYEGKRAYDQSKLAQIMFTFDLAEELADTGVSTTAVHPATLMPTKLARNAHGHTVSSLEEGTSAVVRLATSPGLAAVTGGYFNGTERARAHEQAYDETARARLRRLSQRLTGER